MSDIKNLKIIFMGTPEFAVPSLKILVENNYNVVAVITAPDKPSGRGLKLTPSAVKEYALQQNLPILQPTNLKSEDFLAELKSYQAEVQVVVAFRMLPESVWNMPKHGTFNLHASLLPNYRGAAPINWAIINGEKETGCTTFFLKHEIDTGDIIFQEKEPIEATDNAESLYHRLMHKGAELVLKTIKAISQGSVNTIPQKFSGEHKNAPKIFKETCQINWNKKSTEIRDFIRGLSPYPGAWTIINGKTYKIFNSHIDSHVYDSVQKIGDYYTDHKSILSFKTLDGFLTITEIQAFRGRGFRASV
jgi:methionyl-tRNA formyltransferase